MSNYPVRGYIKPSSSFHLYKDWESCVNFLLSAQSKGIDTRAGDLSCKTVECDGIKIDGVENVVNHFFGHIKSDIDK